MGQKDLTQKNLEYYPDVFADILNALLYEGKQVVQPDKLQPAPTETIYPSLNWRKGRSKEELRCVNYWINMKTEVSRKVFRKALKLL